MSHWKSLVVAVAGFSLVAVWSLRAAEDEHKEHKHEHAEKAGEEVTVTGEVVDMACYLDHGAQGAKHADCARTCIESGLPVGLKTKEGQTYLLIGEHKPLNAQLAGYAAKTITVKGKHVTRDGIHMIANAQIVK